jgi:2-phospho-L-lactate transferase/gluconeogenesis factor (CofD/UPF0052 family)
MKLFETFDESIGALKASFAVFADKNAPREAKLSAFAVAMRAEASLQVLNRHIGNNYRKWEISHDAAVELKTVFMEAEKEAIAIAEKARQEAYSKAMAERFYRVSPSVREEMNVRLTDSGWEFDTEY